MIKDEKKIKALVSSIITGDKIRSQIIAKELTESVLVEKEQAIIESFFLNLRGNINV